MSLRLKGPKDAVIIFTASAKKGIRFHFPIRATSTEFRDRFRRLLAEYTEGWREGIDNEGWPQDPPGSAGSIHWWHLQEIGSQMPTTTGFQVAVVGALIVK
jgi:hypothetical protein